MCSERKQVFNWSSEQDEILIEFVKNHEGLYNVQSKDYRKTQLKQDWWHHIGQILNTTANDCSKRWAYIRDYYIRRRGKLTTGTSGETVKKRSEQLSFLDNLSSSKIGITGSFTDTETEENSSNNFCDSAEENLPENMQNEETFKMEECQLSIEATNLETDSPIAPELVDKPERRSSLKRKCVPTESKYSKKSLKFLRQIAEKEDHGRIILQEHDETDLFFAAMAKIVKKLPEKDQAKLRLEIGTTVGKAEVRYLSRSTVSNRRLSTSSHEGSVTFDDYFSQEVSTPAPASSTPRMLTNEPGNKRNFANFS